MTILYSAFLLLTTGFIQNLPCRRFRPFRLLAHNETEGLDAFVKFKYAAYAIAELKQCWSEKTQNCRNLQ